MEITKKKEISFFKFRLHTVHDSVKDKDFELELSWICKASGDQHQMVPKDLAKKANDAALAAAQMED
jgi:20S proteasome subunit alpha 7